MMRKRILSVTLAAVTLVSVGSGAAFAANHKTHSNNGRSGSGNSSQSGTSGNSGSTGVTGAGPFVLCSSAAGAIFAYSNACPSGYTLETKASLTGPAGPKGDKGDPGSAASAGTKIVHKTVQVDADFQAGSAAERTITFTGLPAFVSGGSQELSGSNNGGIPDGYGAAIAVVQTPAPTNGQTTRKFLITPTGFNGSESFTLDVWLLVTT